MNDTDVLIVGGGVAGLRLATLLERAGTRYLVCEAKERLGGRVLTRSRHASASSYFDLGPTWVWPHQPAVLGLLRELKIDVFEQYSHGLLVHEDAHGHVRRDLDFSTMQGALRLDGGMQALTRRLRDEVDERAVLLSARVGRIVAGAGRSASVTLDDGRSLRAQRVVLALPPRVIAETIAFEPALPERLLKQMRSTPTWMAGHAKAVAIYSEPFWRARGLSGDALSQRGPLGELHDASPRDASPGALFGFFAASAAWRKANASHLAGRIRKQLEGLFGAPAGEPEDLFIIDWATDPHVATEADAVPPREHPAYAPLASVGSSWQEILLFAGTEVAPREAGYVEGALLAAEAAARTLR